MQPVEHSPSVGFAESFNRKWQYFLDKTSPHVLLRWLISFIVFSTYVLRVYLLNGWYIVTYGLGIFILNQLIGFLSPQVTNSYSLSSKPSSC